MEAISFDRAPGAQASGFFVSRGEMSVECTRILQFGTGRFLRSFVDLFVSESNTAGRSSCEIVAVQSTGSDRARHLNVGPFHVAIRGMECGERIDRVETVHSVKCGLSADEAWASVVELAVDPMLNLVVSNTTEAGLALDETEAVRSGVPASYPAKLLDVLLHRFEAGLDGVSILPCELVDGNGHLLRDLVVAQSDRWQVDDNVRSWLMEGNVWCNTLVDRIVSAPPDDHPLLKEDPLLSCAEPFALWAIDTVSADPIDHPAIEIVEDVTTYALRKMRVLNGAHTALVAHALGRFTTVREAMADADTRDWLTTLVRDELVPCVKDRVDDAEGFASSVFERFDNPFLDHRLEDIALHQEDKVRVRLLPSYEDYKRMFGRPPALLGKAIADYL